MRGRRKGGQMAAFPITVAGPLASNAQPAAAARQQAAQTPGPHAIRGGTADGTRNASIRTRRIVTCRAASRSPWPAAARNRRISRARSRCAPFEVDCPVKPDSRRCRRQSDPCAHGGSAHRTGSPTRSGSSGPRQHAARRWPARPRRSGLEAMARRRAPTPATAGCRPHATPGPAAETAGSMTGSTSGSEGGSSPKPVRTGLSGESRLSGWTTTHRIRPAVFPTTRDARCPLADTCARTLLVTPGTADPARAQDTTCLPSSPTTRAGQVTTSCNLVGIYRPHDPRDRQQQQRRVPAAERRVSGSEGGSGRNPSGPDSGEANRADVRRRAG